MMRSAELEVRPPWIPGCRKPFNTAPGSGWLNTANALGFGENGKELDADRQAFLDFTTLVDALAAEDLKSVPFVAEQYAIRASVVDPTQPTDVVPNEIAWPDGTGVKLADASDCAVVDAKALGTAFAA